MSWPSWSLTGRSLPLVDAWNSFAGVAPFDELRPVKKFTSRKTAVARIWAAVGHLATDVAEPARTVAPAPKTPKTGAGKAPHGRPCAKGRASIATQQESAGDRRAKQVEGGDAGRDSRDHCLAKTHPWRGLVSRLGSKGASKSNPQKMPPGSGRTKSKNSHTRGS
jgi:hypothetical protein